MGWRKASSHGLLLEDGLADNVSGVAINKQRLLPPGKFGDVPVDIFVDEIRVVGLSGTKRTNNTIPNPTTITPRDPIHISAT